MSDRRSSDTATIIAFFAGAALAAGAAMLLTPRTGREVREKLGNVTDEAVSKLKSAVREAKFKASCSTKEEQDKFEGGGCWI